MNNNRGVLVTESGGCMGKNSIPQLNHVYAYWDLSSTLLAQDGSACVQTILALFLGVWQMWRYIRMLVVCVCTKCILHILCLPPEPSLKWWSRHPITMEDSFCLAMTGICTSSLGMGAEPGTHLESLATHRTSKWDLKTLRAFLWGGHDISKQLSSTWVVF